VNRESYARRLVRGDMTAHQVICGFIELYALNGPAMQELCKDVIRVSSAKEAELTLEKLRLALIVMEDDGNEKAPSLAAKGA